jgi:hypothetical protein
MRECENEKCKDLKRILVKGKKEVRGVVYQSVSPKHLD